VDSVIQNKIQFQAWTRSWTFRFHNSREILIQLRKCLFVFKENPVPW